MPNFEYNHKGMWNGNPGWTRLITPFLLVASSVSSLAASGTEDYAVYSVVLANITITDSNLNQRLLIARKTLDTPELLSPSANCPGLSADLRRLVDDLLTANHGYRGVPGMLEDGNLRIDRPYVLMDPRQADQWRRRHFQPQVPTDPPDRESSDPFPESNLIQLSSVLFNGEKTLAMVYISRSCGNLCGLSQWRILESKNGVWHILPTANCGTIN